MRTKDERTAMLIGEDSLEKLRQAKVAVFGIGGVGGYATEALARAGVGELHLCDADTVSETNINRQIIATYETVGMLKTDAFEERIRSVDKDCKVVKYPIFYTDDEAYRFDFASFDYIIDAIDTVSAKISLAVRAEEAGVPIIAAMGAGNKLDPTAFEVTDIYKTSVCPLARVMRTELKKRGVKRLKVVYSKEPARTPMEISSKTPTPCDENSKKRSPASISFVPSAAGLIIASEVIKDIINK
jgi:tRNA A37 threonylcarbamoyladenosine dehydratase